MRFKQKKISACMGMLFGSILISGGALAQIAPPPDYDQKLKDVVVEASRSGTPLDEMPLNTTILTPEVLEISPDQTIDQILKNVPGVILPDQPYYQRDPTGQSINTRGLGNARTLVLIDGVPANDAFYGTVQWNLVPTSSIESVEYVRGGVSSLWGNYGMGGVINIRTKNPTNSQQEVSGSAGGYGTTNGAVSKDLLVNDSLQLRASFDYFSSLGYDNYSTLSPATSANHKTGQQATPSKNTNARLQGYFKLDPDTNGFFRMGYHTMADDSSNYMFATNLMNETDASAGITKRINDTSKIQVSAYYENTIFNKQNGSTTSATASSGPKDTPYINSNNVNPYSTVGGGIQYTNDTKGWIDQVIFGADARNISGSNTTNNFYTSGNTITSGNAGALRFINYAKGEQNFSGLMAQLKSKAEIVPLEATLSARVDNWNSQTPTYYSQSATTGNTTLTNVPTQNKTYINPTLGLLYKLNSSWDLRSSAYRAFHAPGMNNTLRSYGSSSGTTFANPNLSPETMVGYEFGSDYRWKQGFAQFTAFNNYVQNAVASYKLNPNDSTDQALGKNLCGGTGTWSTTTSGAYGICPAVQTSGKSILSYYTNNQNLLSQGIEFQAHHDINRKWAADLNYAYTQTKLTYSATSDPANQQVGGVPRNIAGGGLTYYPTTNASITTTIRYVGNSWLDTAHANFVPTYTIVGLRGNYQFDKSTTGYVSVVNLFNRAYNTLGSSSNYILGQPLTLMVGGRIIF